MTENAISCTEWNVIHNTYNFIKYFKLSEILMVFQIYEIKASQYVSTSNLMDSYVCIESVLKYTCNYMQTQTWSKIVPKLKEAFRATHKSYKMNKCVTFRVSQKVWSMGTTSISRITIFFKQLNILICLYFFGLFKCYLWKNNW